MDHQEITEELLEILEQNGISIRTEPLGGRGGGLCKLKEKTLFFVDSEATAADMAAISAQTVQQLVKIENIYIKPQVRDFIEKYTSPLDHSDGST